MKLKKVLKDIPVVQVKGSKEIEISGICANSQLIAPGNLFIAKKGLKFDGTSYIPEAINHGATAIVTDIYDPSFKEITQIICKNVAEVEGRFSANFYQMPSQELFTVGITGTNGKTTTSFLVKYLLEQLNLPCGLIGTIEYILGRYRYKASHTTPDVHSNHHMLREMVHQGCQAAVMEVTSHALDQKRVEHIDYDIAIYTNLTQDHLDYHQNMECYAAAKRKLFLQLDQVPSKKSKQIIANLDCPWFETILKGIKTPIFTFGIDSPADLRACPTSFGPTGTHIDLHYQGRSYSTFFPLIGRFNIYNCLAAIAVGLTRKITLEKLISLAQQFPPPPGRLEPIQNDLDLNLFVDFAHTEDALYKALECLSELKKGKIITVFGCGGDRDKTKRPKMAQASASFSDLTIVTSDNPRSEDPLKIIQEIAEGFSLQDNYIVQPDRFSAIAFAIEKANPGDIILVAGKGHETTQIFAHHTIEFDDRKIAQEICAKMSLNTY
ncbi:UDP-N-acetylmuramoyl-L-alanyl-D-glutamate--2,6-diaminopimelateligase [Parachlamydia acanthamoebae UV-7]|jgi:UDP-N-acetylmuramoyl-L-alanyl-D-glutamate--2,6-diaminopimelate ligase|uniref:UDP-N-acetylmuramoyl-L-alanyl-D-glutamate--2,6-diaminopimelate ligase n=2 Tax=Parachlamydia acanthamoebae TaxID=83552 RepID=F8L102_PARAV|nr:UDP-N-acetylmuramoyl-L-alanyl-D-glutamate--2,6-diaminopimelate ligase [Parachlamydia acanthamoebae]CCB86921.1 UDP-N-acetylmuramoyl-L-alanyl-D-glutamate--2,6-diaminopimelateligase [Parachlamydia acanthamoebae UV-7]